ncbi:hypothetical protein M3231_07000 [Neobacillus mesonae]|nr:hypothetical protein [Neobacillus mesonae]
MSFGPSHDRLLKNQSSVTFVSGTINGVAYSNTVNIPLTGPVISVNKSASLHVAALGSVITYTLLVTNTGNAEADILLYELLPEGTEFIINSVLRDGIPIPEAVLPGRIDIGSLGILASTTVSFQVIVSNIPTTNELFNEARVEYTFQALDGRTISRSVTSNQVRIPLANLQLTVSQRANTLQTFVGDVVTFTVTIQNTGTVPVTNARLEAVLSKSMEFIPGSVVLDGVISPRLDPVKGFILPVISSGEVLQLTYQVRILSITDPLTSEVLISYNSNGQMIRTGSNEIILSPISPMITMNVTVSPNQVTYGGLVEYTVTILNEGDLPVEGLYFITFPEGLFFSDGSVRINGVTIHNSNPVIGLRLGTLLPNSRTVVTFLADVSYTPNSQISQLVLTNQSALQYKFRLSDGRTVALIDEAQVQVLFVAPVIHIQLKAAPLKVEPGDEITFQAAIRNTGNLAAFILLRGLIPPGTELISGRIRFPDGSFKLFSLRDFIQDLLDVGELAPGEVLEIEYIVGVEHGSPFYDDIIKGYITALFSYLYDDQGYTMEVDSNKYLIVIEQHDE